MMIECGPDGRRVWISPNQVVLLVSLDGCSLLRLTCPLCGVRVEECLGDNEVEALIAVGVTPIVVPAEALEEHDGPPLTPDDLIDLHFVLESPGWEAHLDPSRRRGLSGRLRDRWGRRHEARWDQRAA